ncbi:MULTISPECIES: hypothetical protein [Paraburkholderia]|uniref:hypothetical protein n=1 Tax=Paraburkholderia TaxID=1822464 RepID=UPI002254327F|nr:MULTISPECIES: hypothetical protein [Paraburkholderia]MCX4163133.1 hypothetical protein [Paraburkholderia megapolitana]MDN7158629.1 hypothetical protein [Paraburkholderia sp. CHISQ3]MDQ6495676.1 hypothetical protein [Paraburkholderia megapolitana]
MNGPKKLDAYRIGGAPLTKAQLLPPTAASARELSLRNHLAVAACRSGNGNRALLRELFAIACLSYFLREAGFAFGPDTLYGEVQGALERCVERCSTDEPWQVDEPDGVALGRLVTIYDRQFSTAPMYVMEGAHKRLKRLAVGEWRFPWARRSPAPAPEQSEGPSAPAPEQGEDPPGS